jgi:branched-chain amino acid transport system ATP-binding protein
LALASAPKILLLDEPLAGVGHGRVQQTMELIERVSHGRTILLVEHNMDAVMRFSEQIIVMYAGRVIAQGTPDQVRADPRVQQAYLGS